MVENMMMKKIYKITESQ